MTTTISTATTVADNASAHGYQAIRSGAGLIDYSGAGLFELTGRDSREFLASASTRGVDFLLEGQTQQALVLTDDGTVIGDIVVHGLGDGFLIQVWPDQVGAVGARLRDAAAGAEVELTDRTDSRTVVGIEGPDSYRLVDPFVDFAISSLGYQSWAAASWQGHELMICRIGVTGEFGYLLIGPAAATDQLTSELTAGGAIPVDRSAVDVCRMEMRFPNLEAELPPSGATPFALGLQWLVDFDSDFAGKDALLRAEPDARTPVCWQGESGSAEVPAAGADVSVSDKTIGTVLHAVFSPSLDRVIGTASMDADCAAAGLGYQIDTATVHTVSAPFLIATSFGRSMD